MKSCELFVDSRKSMGTIYTIYLYACGRQHAQACFEAAFEEIQRLDETLSNYRDSSELSRINRLAGKEPVTTDPEVFDLLQRALAFSEQTEGAFDITVGPLMRSWGFFRGEGRYPSGTELAQAMEGVGYEKVLLDPATRRVRFTVPGVELDLGAIGKGYAVNRVVRILQDAGVTAAFIDAGSSTMYALNAPPGKAGWIVRIPEPEDRSQAVCTVELRNQSLSTSGNYEKFFELEGHRYCHVMNPRAGVPVEGILQTTLIGSDSTTTDALSNAMFVMGPESGSALLSTISDARGLWITDEAKSQRVRDWQWNEVCEIENQPVAGW